MTAEQSNPTPYLANTFFHLEYKSTSKPIFHIDGNYMFFLVRLNKIISPVAAVYAYNLLPHEIHLLLRTHDREQLFNYFLETEEEARADAFDPNKLIQAKVDELKAAYTKAVQRLYSDQEEVFGHYFQKTALASTAAVLDSINAIHWVASMQDMAALPKDWKHSSYNNIARENRTFEHGTEVLELFGGKEAFLLYHQQRPADSA